MSERIGSSLDDIAIDPAPSNSPDPRTNAGAREVATRSLERTREAQPYADAIGATLRERTTRPVEEAPRTDDYRHLHAIAAETRRIENEDAELKSVLDEFRSRPDVEFFSPAAQDEVFKVWIALGGRPADLDKAYHQWLKNSEAALSESIEKPSADELRTRRGALAAASATRGSRSEWEARHRTVRTRGPMTRREALSAALATVERAKTAR